LDQALETVQELPPQQQEMLFEVLRLRRIQAWEDFQSGRLQPQSAEVILRELAAPPLPPPVRLRKPLTDELLDKARREGRA
jgi:hypothetical protein